MNLNETGNANDNLETATQKQARARFLQLIQEKSKILEKIPQVFIKNEQYRQCLENENIKKIEK